MEAVIILGAGSSADFGVPTLRNVFKDPYARRYLIENDRDLHRMLQETFWGPRGCDLDSSEESLTVEEILTVLRDWEQETGLPGPPEPRRFRKGLNCLIERAVFEGKSSRGAHLNELIKITGRTFERVTWASFNWDAIFESSFWYSSDVPWPAGIRSNPQLAIDVEGWRSGSRKHELLKLHGSINWWMIDDRLSYLSWGSGGPLQTKWAEYAESPDPVDYPVILEPSAYKYRVPPYELLEPQWDVFLGRLLEADCVVIVGYSLPPGDSQARSKILTAFQVNDDCRWGVIDNSIEICEQYQRLLGRGRVRSTNMTLAGFNNNIHGNLTELIPNVEFAAAE